MYCQGPENHFNQAARPAKLEISKNHPREDFVAIHNRNQPWPARTNSWFGYSAVLPEEQYRGG